MQETTLVMDGHVHLYPEYNWQKAIQTGLENIQNCLKQAKVPQNKNSATVWLLTERWDCTFFKQIYDQPQQFSFDGYNFIPSPEKEALLLERNGQVEHYILAGRQLVSNDGLEVLSLATNLFVEDRTRSTKELIKAVNAAGGVPVMNWAPGKWFSKRGKIVESVFADFKTRDLVIGDSPLRHTFWSKPALMKSGMERGFKLIAGSDPLPFAGEEKFIGTYCFAITGQFDSAKPVTSIRNLLRKDRKMATLLGRRNGPLTFAIRETRIMLK